MADDWIVLQPRRGKRPSENARVTLAWRTNSRKDVPGRSMTGYVNVAKAVMAQLGWQASSKVEVAHNPAGTALRVRLANSGYRCGVTNGCGTFQAFLPWVPQEPRKAEAIGFRVEGSVLLLDLPAWAQQKPAPALLRPAIPLVETREEMEAEAARLFRLRHSVQQVARAVKLPVPDLVRIEAGVKAEREGRAA